VGQFPVTALIRTWAVLNPNLFWLFVVVRQEIRAYGFPAELAQQSSDLTPMVIGMVDHMDHLLPKRIRVALTSLVEICQLFN